MLSRDGRGDALAVAHAVSGRTDLRASTDLGTASPCMLAAPRLAATGFVSADPFSLPRPSWAGGSRQKAGGTQQEMQTPAVSTCCAKELRKHCYSREEPATTRCEGRSPDVGGMSASHNWERCLPPQWQSRSVIPSFLSYLLLPKQSASSKLSLSSTRGA